MQESTERFDQILDPFSTGEELNDSLRQLQKRGIERMLEGELDHHLGHHRHQRAQVTIYTTVRPGRPSPAALARARC